MTPVTGPVKRGEFLNGVAMEGSDMKKQEKKNYTSVKIGRGKDLDFLSSIEMDSRIISRSPSIIKKDHLGTEVSSSSMSVLNLGESEGVGSLGKIALRDDFIKKPYDSPRKPLGGIKKTLFKGVALKSIVEEKNKEECSEDEIEKEEWEDKEDNIIILPTESNKCLLTNNSFNRNDLQSERKNLTLIDKRNSENVKSKIKLAKPSLMAKNLTTLRSMKNVNKTPKSELSKKSSFFKGNQKIVRNITFSEQVNMTHRLDLARKQIKRVSILQTILSCFSILLIIIDNEVEYPNVLAGVKIDMNVPRFLNIVITIILYAIIIAKLILQNKIFKITYSVVINKGYTFYEILKIFFEFLICTIIIPPYFETIMDYEYFFYYIKRHISVSCFLKLHYFIDQVIQFSPFNYKKATFLRSLLHLEPTKRSLLQSWFQENKHTCLILFPFIFFPSMSYILMLSERVSEKDYSDLDGGNCVKPDDYFRFIWITGVAFFTSK
jgi:hypothetical protein